MSKYRLKLDSDAEVSKAHLAELIEKVTKYKVTHIKDNPYFAWCTLEGRELNYNVYTKVGEAKAYVKPLKYDNIYTLVLNEKKRVFLGNKQGVRIEGFEHGGYRFLKTGDRRTAQNHVTVFTEDNQKVRSEHLNEELTDYAKRFVQRG